MCFVHPCFTKGWRSVKKIFAILMCLAVVGVLGLGVTGCDNKTKTPTPVTPKTPATGEKTPTTDKTPTDKTPTPKTP